MLVALRQGSNHFEEEADILENYSLRQEEMPRASMEAYERG